MSDILHEFAIILILLLVWLFLGGIFNNCDTNFSITKTLIFGFVFYYAAFEILYIPMLLLFASLSLITVVWCVIITVLIAFSIVFKRRLWQRAFFEIIYRVKRINFPSIAAVAAVIVIIIISLYYELSGADDVFYTGTVTTAVYTDSMFCFDPHTGMPFNSLSARYALNGYLMANAVLCKVFSIHSLLLTRFVLPATTLIIMSVISYRVGVYLFKQNATKALTFVVFIVALNLFGVYNIYMPSSFLIFRTEEGKSLTANIVMPLILLFFVKYIYEYKFNSANTEKLINRPDREEILSKEQKYNFKYWFEIFLSVLASVSFSFSAVYLVPVALGAYFIPYALVEKKPRIIFNLLFCLTPAIFLFVLAKYGGSIFLIPAGRFS